MNIDLAEVFHHDCKSIVDQMKEKRLISYLGSVGLTLHDIDLAKVFHHDCKSIVDQMKEKMFIFLLRRFQISIFINCKSIVIK